MSVAEICQFIEADSLGYLSLAGMQEATNISPNESCVACWNEKYPTRITSAAETMHSRNESAKQRAVPIEF
jgi:amidophosphoribosyltransferase